MIQRNIIALTIFALLLMAAGYAQAVMSGVGEPAKMPKEISVGLLHVLIGTVVIIILLLWGVDWLSDKPKKKEKNNQDGPVPD